MLHHLSQPSEVVMQHSQRYYLNKQVPETLLFWYEGAEHNKTQEKWLAWVKGWGGVRWWWRGG